LCLGVNSSIDSATRPMFLHPRRHIPPAPVPSPFTQGFGILGAAIPFGSLPANRKNSCRAFVFLACQFTSIRQDGEQTMALGRAANCGERSGGSSCRRPHEPWTQNAGKVLPHRVWAASFADSFLTTRHGYKPAAYASNSAGARRTAREINSLGSESASAAMVVHSKREKTRKERNQPLKQATNGLRVLSEIFANCNPTRSVWKLRFCLALTL